VLACKSSSSQYWDYRETHFPLAKKRSTLAESEKGGKSAAVVSRPVAILEKGAPV
jgi:hypothetical protein